MQVCNWVVAFPENNFQSLFDEIQFPSDAVQNSNRDDTPEKFTTVTISVLV
jgi:hypothetical protein